MAKKKEYAKKDYKSIIITVIVILVSLAILGASVISMTANLLSNWIVKIDNEKIQKNEFNYYLHSQKTYLEMIGGPDIWDYPGDNGYTYAEITKSNALDSMISTKIAANGATANNISLSDEDQEEIKERVESYFDFYDDKIIEKLGITESDLTRIFETSFLAEKFYDFVTEDYVTNEDEFENEFNEYITTSRDVLPIVMIDSITTETKEDAEKAKEAINNGNDFIDVLKQYSTSYDKDSEYGSGNLLFYNFSDEIESAVRELDEEEVTEILEDDSTFYIIRVNSIEERDIEELRESQKNYFDQDAKSEIYKEELEKLVNNSKIKINETLYYTIDIKTVGGITEISEDDEDDSEDNDDKDNDDKDNDDKDNDNKDNDDKGNDNKDNDDKDNNDEDNDGKDNDDNNNDEEEDKQE